MKLNYAVLIILALMTSAQCQQTADDWFNKGSALHAQGKYDEWHSLDDGYYQIKFLSPSFHGAEPDVVPDDDGTTAWYRNRVFIDETYFNCLGTMRALNESYDVMGINLTHDLIDVADMFGGRLVREEELTIPTYKGDRKGKKGFIDVGLGDYFICAIIPLDEHQVLLVGVNQSELKNLIPSLSVGES